MTDLNEILVKVRQAIDAVGGEHAQAVRVQAKIEEVRDLIAAARESMSEARGMMAALVANEEFPAVLALLASVAESGDITAAHGVLQMANDAANQAVGAMIGFGAVLGQAEQAQGVSLQMAEEAAQHALAAQAILIGWYPFPIGGAAGPDDFIP